jgi:cytoskeleton protein RodZ
LGKANYSPVETAGQPEAIGQQLRRAREASALSITSAAASLRLPPRVVMALEESDFKQFAPVYARGYLRNYARLLELPADPIIEAYNRSFAADSPVVQTPTQTQQIPAPSEDDTPTEGGKFFFVLVAVIGLPLIFWGASKLWQPTAVESAPSPLSVENTDANAEAAAGHALELPGQHAAAEPAPASSQPAVPPAPVSQAMSQSIAIPPENPPPAAVAPNPPPAATPPAPVAAAGQGPDNISLHLSAGAWVSVRDQTGRRLVYQNLPAGTEQTYAGQAPFNVVLGNAPATRVEFNGQPYEPPKPKAGTVARFTLGGVAKANSSSARP